MMRPSHLSSDLICLETLREDRRRFALQSPEHFRRAVVIQPKAHEPVAASLLPWQVADFRALDPAWMALADRMSDRSAPVRRAYLERPRGHSKTTDTAIQIAWALFAARHPVNGLAAAADLEQATLIHAAVQQLVRANAPILDAITFVEHGIRNRETGSQIRIISSDVASSWGELPHFVVCDELCHWRTPELWESLFSSAAKRPDSILIVLSNAGFGRGWQWNVREAARTDPAWHFSSLNGPQAPWITEESLAEQRRLLPPAVFARLWLNRWQHSDGEFVSLAEAQACSDSNLTPRDSGQPGIRYVAAIDYAEKNDLTVGCVCHVEGETVIVDRMDVVRPAPGRPTQVRWVSDWMTDMASRFHDIRFVVDEYQLLSAIQTLSQSFDIRRFAFAAGEGNHRIAMGLRQLILERRVRWFPGCGVIAGEEDRVPGDSLEHELAGLIVRQRSSGLLRFDHPAGQHDDRAFALGVACDELRNSSEGEFRWDVCPPSPQGGFGLLR